MSDGGEMMVDTTPFKICIQRAETRQEWDEMQDDYIARSLEACRRIETLEAALRTVKEWHGYGLPPETTRIIDAALEGKDD